MSHRISIYSRVPDARAAQHLHLLKDRFPRAGLTGVALSTLYSTAARISAKDLERLARVLANPITEDHTTDRILSPERFAYAIEIGFHPGVTDNVGNTVRQMLTDMVGAKDPSDTTVYSSVCIFLSGKLSRGVVERMAAELHNPLIESAHIYSQREFKAGRIPIRIPQVELPKDREVLTVDLNVSEELLARLGKEGIEGSDGVRRGPLALGLAELQAIRTYFSKREKRMPTDLELESIAQTWSEHCKHTIFSDPLDEIANGIYRHYIKGATQKIRAAKGKKDFCVSVFTDNSGAIVFDDEFLVTHKVETHNSPSALDPYGGAMTGIVGVNRDTLGFGMGAKPIANIYGFCVAEPADTRTFFRDQNLTQEVLPARRILQGVVRGINAGGNQSGIPTPLGFVYTDPRFRGKPLVFAGTVGLIPRRSRGRDLTKKRARPGDYIVAIGGRVGLDGIHGATFSSEALQAGSPATAVQIGDPITQKKLSDVLIQEARDRKLYHSITDNGAGGLSCAAAEMARECGGCTVRLETVPLKYPGLSPWQIWISESQERMTLSVPKESWPEFKKLMQSRDVEATRIGQFNDSGRCVVTYGKKKVMDMELAFLHDGRPPQLQRSSKPVYTLKDAPKSARRANVGDTLIALLKHSNIGSRAFISEQYDHEVQGTSVTKPLQGKGRVNSDAAVLRPLPGSSRGVVLAHGYAPSYSDLDAYAMAAVALDTAIRNAICAGADPDHLAILDNFCWSSGNTPERLFELKEAARACYDGAIAHQAPFISGKDSMFNDFKGFDAKGKPVHIAAPPTLLVSAISVMKDVTAAMTIDAKAAGDGLYLIGETHEELGGSEYFSHLSKKAKKVYQGTVVPKTDFKKNVKTYRAVAGAIRKGMVSAAIGLSHGGLGAALSKVLIAGGKGATIDLKAMPGTAKELDAKLFSESQGRILMTVPASQAKAFEKLLTGIRFAKVGVVTDAKNMVIKDGKRVVSTIPLSTLARAYRSPFKNI